MFLTQSAIKANPRLLQHYQELQANRAIWANQQKAMLEANRAVLTGDMLAANNLGLSQTFWAEIDAAVVELRDKETGMEILNDLLSVQTVLPVGKTARIYDISGDISDDVAVSMDGQAPYSFDSSSRTSEGDPVPVFTAGFGVNWRLAAGMQSVGADLVLESQEHKLRKYNKRLVSYLLDGDTNIQVQSYAAQGLRNHRNTAKLDLGSSGANINLTTATQVQLAAFFTTGAFGTTARQNRVDVYDVLWVSPEIYANLMSPAQATIGGADILTGGSVMQILSQYIPAREVRQTFALSGNEFVAYQRRRDVVSPIVGMATSVLPLPRPLPQSNYNFQIMGAMGVQVRRDDSGRSGVLYGAELT